MVKMLNKIFLNDRSFIALCGEDKEKFLQGLITNDIYKLNADNLLYACILNSQGRFLYDLFIFKDAEQIILDVIKERQDELLKKLNFYKLRSKITVNEIYYQAFQILTPKQPSFDQNLLIFKDPRHQDLGYRIYSKNTISDYLSTANYHLKRIELKIAEGEYDLTYNKSFPLEYGFDNLNAIDYNKGCYVGQELTARTHHLGQIRKKLFHVKLSHSVTKGEEMKIENQDGIILSSIQDQKGITHALVLARINENS